MCRKRLCDFHALSHGHAIERDERHHVRCSHARVYPPVLPEIDLLHGNRYTAEYGLGDGVGIARHGKNRAMVPRVRVHVEQVSAADPGQGVR